MSAKFPRGGGVGGSRTFFSSKSIRAMTTLGPRTLPSFFFLNKMFGKNKIISVQVAIMITQ